MSRHKVVAVVSIVLLLAGGAWLRRATNPDVDAGSAPREASETASRARGARGSVSAELGAGAARTGRTWRGASSGAAPIVASRNSTESPGEAGTLSLRARRASGEPIVGVALAIQLRGADALRVDTSTTDAEGRVELPPVSAGVWALLVRAPGFLPARRAFRVGSGDERREIDLTLEEGREVRGVVRDAEGAPIAGAVVSAAREDSQRDRRRATTDAEGAFRLSGLSDGAWILAAGAAHRASAGPILIEPRDERIIDITLGPERGLRAVVVDESGRPVAGALVTLRVPGVTTYLLRWPATPTDARGEARTPGSLSDPRAMVAVRVTHEEFASLDEIVETGALERGATFVLARAPRVEGQVVDGTAEPVRSARVTLLGPVDRSLVTTSDGRFDFGRVPPGTYRVGGSTRERGSVPESEVVVASDLDLRLVLVEGEFAIAGRVVGIGGEPAPLVPVLLERGAVRREASADREGRFRFAALESGTYRLATGDRTRGRASIPEVEAGDEDVAIELRPSGSLRGVIDLDSSGGGDRSVQLRSLEVGGGVFTHRFSADDAWFRFDDVPAGSYALWMVEGDDAKEVDVVEIEPGVIGETVVGGNE